MIMKNVNKHSTSIKNWSSDDQPREKMLQQGAANLSNAELIAILIRTGNQTQSAVEVSKEIMLYCKNNLNELGKMNAKELQQFKGMGATKSITIAAAFELGRRRIGVDVLNKSSVRSSADVAAFLSQKIQDLSYEVFAIILLNRANKIIHFEIISRGGITGTVADPRIILKLAISYGATSIILSHNHPSGNLQPSKADESITNKIKEAALLIDIKVLDHIIISEEGYYSFMDEGML
jgi:DNA repair protein RadC